MIKLIHSRMFQWKGYFMRVNFNLSQLNNSQPLRFSGCCDKKPSFKNVKNNPQSTIDYKKEYEKSKAQLDYMSKKYEVLCNICALSMNPKFKF